MILTCPSCQKRYVVPDSAIGAAGRQVRCAACRRSWFQHAPAPVPAESLPPPAPIAAPPVAPEPPPSAEPAYDEQETFLRPRRNPAKTWTIVAIIAAALMTGAVFAIQYFGLPDLGQRIGIPVQTGDALGIVDESARPRRLESGNDMLEVSGAIVNRTDQVQRVPQIRAELKDGDGRVIYSWSIAPPAPEIQPNGRMAFDSAEIGVPSGGRTLTLNFGPVG
ncbi:MAG: zinc-ribbon domain-containing protein [Sphingomonas sp.]